MQISLQEREREKKKSGEDEREKINSLTVFISHTPRAKKCGKLQQKPHH